MAIPFETTSTISITLLSVIVPFFIFAITLLGNAIEKAKEEESKIKKQEQENFNNQIKDIENKIKTSKETGDSTELEKQLEKLKKNREKSNIQLKNTQKKYSLLNFKKSVVFPGSFFILAILFNESAKIYMESSKISISLWILAVVAISTGIYRLCQSLRLVQEVGITSEEFQTKKFTHAFKNSSYFA